MNKIKWGIIGLGSTYSRFLKGLSLSEGGELYAIASRTQSKLEKIKTDYPDCVAYTDYDALLSDESIDAIYITLRHNDHYKWAKKALEKGIAVLCEKPATLSVEETTDLVQTAQKHQVMFVEALKTRFMPLNKKLHEILDERLIGDIRTIENGFGYVIPDEHARYLYDSEIGGILYDVGSYTLGALLDLVKCDIKSFETEYVLKRGVDAYERITIYFENGVTGIANNALDRSIDRNMTIIGDKGSIFVRDYHRASSIIVNLNDGNHFEYNDDTDDFFGEIEAVQNGIQNKEIEDERMSHQDSIQLIKLITEIKKELK